MKYCHQYHTELKRVRQAHLSVMLKVNNRRHVQDVKKNVFFVCNGFIFCARCKRDALIRNASALFTYCIFQLH